MSEQTKTKPTTRRNFILPDEQWEHLQARALDECRTATDVLRELIRRDMQATKQGTTTP